MMYEIMTPAEAKALGGLTLAFFGDSVYEVYVREQIVKLGTMPVDKLHKKSCAICKCRISVLRI